MIHVRKIAGPNPEPITLAEARIFLRQDVPGFSGDTMQDSLLESWIRAARAVCEKTMDKVIGPQTFIASLSSFAELYGYDSRYAPPPWCTGMTVPSIQLPVRPLRSIEEIRYRYNDAAYSVVDPSVYRVTELSRELVLNYGRTWPTAGWSQDSVLIEFTAGMGYPTDSDIGVEKIDDDVIAAMRLLLGHFWSNRSEVIEGHILAQLPLGVRELLWSNRNSIGV